LGILYEALEVIRVIYRVSSIWLIGTITLISQINSERDWKEGEIMTDETLKQYIVDYKPKGNREIQMAHFDGYDFTFLIHDGKAIGGVLDMNREPQIHVLEKYRGHGYGVRLLDAFTKRCRARTFGHS
jgi:GNAT superfamily N-acetyltransferase